MILGKIVVSGPDAELNSGIVDAVFAYLKNKKQPAIFIEDYDHDQQSYVVGDTFAVCLTKVQK